MSVTALIQRNKFAHAGGRAATCRIGRKKKGRRDRQRRSARGQAGRHRGKLATVIDRIEHGHHVYRAYFRNAFLKQYEKFSTFLRNELCSNNLTDFGLRK